MSVDGVSLSETVTHRDALRVEGFEVTQQGGSNGRREE